jgi:hypothetical protein
MKIKFFYNEFYFNFAEDAASSCCLAEEDDDELDEETMASTGDTSASGTGTSADERKKRPRTAFTAAQIKALEAEFERNKYLSVSKRLHLSRTLHLTETQVSAYWLQKNTHFLDKMSIPRSNALYVSPPSIKCRRSRQPVQHFLLLKRV